MTKTAQHKARVKIWLLRGRKLTQAIAIKQWKCYRLSEYIRRLRKDGLNIDMEIVHNKNGTCYGVYKIKKYEQENATIIYQR